MRTADGEVKIAGTRAQLSQLVIVLDEKNHVTATGDFGLAAPFDYAGQLDVHLPDLALFQPLLAKMKREEKIAGLQTLALLSTPTTYGESFGLYILEADI